MKFKESCETSDEVVNGHTLKLLVLRDREFDTACKLLGNIVPSHYASPHRMAAILQKLGKEKAAEYLRQKLPQNPKIRSGDLGEILATQYIDECTDYKTPIKRLRWKDHREMAMRGDDVIAIAVPTEKSSIRF